MNKIITTREAVSICLTEIMDQKRPGHIVLGKCLKDHPEWTKQERSFTVRVCNGTMERLITIDYVLGKLSKTKVARMKPLIRAVLRMSIYQLLYMDAVPTSAICNEAVKIVKKRGLQGLSGFVNGVLRTAVRKKDELLDLSELNDPFERLSIEYSTPVWLVQQFISEYGEDTAITILSAQYDDIPVSIRRNESRCTQEELITELNKENVVFQQGAYVDTAFYLKEYDNLDKITAFKDGWITVQDESSMMVGLSAGVDRGAFVIDLCAAPGGKTIHLADLIYSDKSKQKSSVKGEIEARDISEYKISLIRENLERCKIPGVTLKVADASVFDPVIQEKADIVIADLPCSGTGVIGKKPDIKYNMSPDQQKELCVLQKMILEQAVKYLKPDGVLIYSTCTLHKAENDGNREYIIKELGLKAEDMTAYLPERLMELEDIKRTASEGYIQLIPGQHKTDGFYVSRYRKKGNDGKSKH